MSLLSSFSPSFVLQRSGGNPDRLIPGTINANVNFQVYYECNYYEDENNRRYDESPFHEAHHNHSSSGQHNYFYSAAAVSSRGHQQSSNRPESIADFIEESDKENRSTLHHRLSDNIYENNRQSDRDEGFVLFRTRQESIDRPMTIHGNNSFNYRTSGWFENDEIDGPSDNGSQSEPNREIRGMDLAPGLDSDEESIGEYASDDANEDVPSRGRTEAANNTISSEEEGLASALTVIESPGSELAPDIDGASNGRRLRRRLFDSVSTTSEDELHYGYDSSQIQHPNRTTQLNNDASVKMDSNAFVTMVSPTKESHKNAIALEELLHPELYDSVTTDNDCIGDANGRFDVFQTLEFYSGDLLVLWGCNNEEMLSCDVENKDKKSEGSALDNANYYSESTKAAPSTHRGISLHKVFSSTTIEIEANDQCFVEEQKDTNHKRNYSDAFCYTAENYCKRLCI